MDGLRGLIIPAQSEEAVADIMQTPTAIRLLNLGATLYLLNNGTNVLAINRPPGAFAKLFFLSDKRQAAQ